MLVLRAAIGFTLVSQGMILYLSDSHTPSLAMWAVALLMVASGTLALIGYMTPLAAIVGGLVTVATWIRWFHAPAPSLFLTRLATFLAAAIAIAIVCLGPGAFSLDARLFGRREIVIRKPSSSRKS